MDNFQCELKARDKEPFTQIVTLIMKQTSSVATHYAFHRRNGVVLFWAKPERELFAVPGMDCTFQGDQTGKDPLTDFRAPVTKLPYKLTYASAPEFLWNFLEEMDYGKQPGIDGSKGYHVCCRPSFGDTHYAVLQVAPQWILYGK